MDPQEREREREREREAERAAGLLTSVKLPTIIPKRKPPIRMEEQANTRSMMVTGKISPPIAQSCMRIAHS